MNLEDTGGYFRIKSDDIKLEAANGEDFLECDANGAVTLYHDDGKRFETTTYGVKVTGAGPNNPTTDAWDTNSSIITSGSYGGGIAMIDGSRGFVQYLHGAGVNWELKNAATDSTPETNIKAIANGAVELYYDNVKKFETTSDGATVTGSLTVTDDISLQDDLLMGDTDAIKLGDSADLTYKFFTMAAQVLLKKLALVI